jgi:hypothetical protein
MYRQYGTLQNLDIANYIGETIAIASFVSNGRLSLHYQRSDAPQNML